MKCHCDFPQLNLFPKWHTSIVSIVCLQLMVFTTFYNEYFVDTDSEDDPTLFEWLPAEDIRRRSDNLMNLGLDREVTAVSRSFESISSS